MFLRLEIRFGDPNLEDSWGDWATILRPIKRVHIHPNYKPSQAYFDIAILEIDQVTLCFTS